MHAHSVGSSLLAIQPLVTEIMCYEVLYGTFSYTGNELEYHLCSVTQNSPMHRFFIVTLLHDGRQCSDVGYPNIPLVRVHTFNSVYYS